MLALGLDDGHVGKNISILFSLQFTHDMNSEQRFANLW
jgi:hypothetical protein